MCVCGPSQGLPGGPSAKMFARWKETGDRWIECSPYGTRTGLAWSVIALQWESGDSAIMKDRGWRRDRPIEPTKTSLRARAGCVWFSSGVGCCCATDLRTALASLSIFENATFGFYGLLDADLGRERA